MLGAKTKEALVSLRFSFETQFWSLNSTIL